MRSRARALLPVLLLLPLGCGACAGHTPAPAPAPARSASAAKATPAPAITTLSPATVDSLIRAAWEKEGITPAPRVEDARFLRRAYLDIVGVIPSLEQVTAFLADTSADKRSKVVDALLASPRYADHWTDVWDRALLGATVRPNRVDRPAFRAWLHKRLAENVGYSRIVAELLTASGPSDAEESGAVNWFLRFQDAPQDLAGNASKLFLGVQIQCAQCHDHKTEAWKTEDFRRFTACFAKVRAEPMEAGEDGMSKRKRFNVHDTEEIALKKRKDPELKAIAAARPTALDGADLSSGDSRREALALWMTAPENPWFAPAIVNRIWAHFLGRGFVNPVTDFRPTNPPAVPEALKALSADFAAHGHDLKHLIRLIVATEVYQRASAPIAKPEGDRLWARFRAAPLGPDELLDAIIAATQLDVASQQKRGDRSVEEMREKLDKQVSFLFDVDEETDAPDYDGSIPQALFLLNSGFLQNAVRPGPGSALREVLDLPGGDDEKIRSLYLRTLSRAPDAEELAAARALLAAPATGKRGAAYEDLFWALLNSSEFSLNH